jgi:hypothetical protein
MILKENNLKHINYKVLTQALDQVTNKVSDQMTSKVSNQVWIRDLDKIWNSVDIQFEKQINKSYDT